MRFFSNPSSNMQLKVMVLLFCFLSSSTWAEKRISIDSVIVWATNNTLTQPRKAYDTLVYTCGRSKNAPFEDKYKIVKELAEFSLYEMRDFKKSMYYMKKLKQQIDGQKDYKYFIQYHNTLGELYYYEGIDPGKSYKEFKTALYILKVNKSHYIEDLIYSNYAISLQSEGKLDEAMRVEKKALEISIGKGDFWLQSIITSNIGVNFLYLQQPDSAEIYFLYSLETAKKTPQKIDEVQRSLFLGLFYNDRQAYDKAMSFLFFVKNNVKQLESFSDKVQLFKGLSTSCLMQNDFKKALEYKDLQLSYKDSVEIFNLKKEVFIYEHELKVKYLEGKNQIQIVENQKNKLQITVSILVIFVLLGFALMLFLSERKSKIIHAVRLEKDLLEKEKLIIEKSLTERDNTAKAMFLLEKDNLIHSITDKLSETLPAIQEHNQGMIRSIIIDLKGTVNHKRWDEFELRFNLVHPDFLKKLCGEFPKLSPNDKKLCAFLSMNMTTKDISNISGQTSHSINIARGRLRKKLNISHTSVDLIEFLARYK